MRSVVLLVVLAVSSPAHAEDRKDPKIAMALSGVGIGVSSALVVGSFLFNTDPYVDMNHPAFYAGLATSVVTPSLGELYAHQWLTIGMGIRGGGVLLAAYGVTRTQEASCNDLANSKCKQLTGTGVALLGLAAIAYIGGAAYDVIDAGDAVERYNATHIGITPMIMPNTGPPGTMTAGLAVTGTF